MSRIEPLTLAEAWNADSETLRQIVQVTAPSDKLASSLADAVVRLAMFGLPISETFADLCQSPDRWVEMDKEFHSLRKRTLDLERKGDAGAAAMSILLENVAKHLWNERTKSTRFDGDSGAWAVSGLQDVLAAMPDAQAEAIRSRFIQSLGG